MRRRELDGRRQRGRLRPSRSVPTSTSPASSPTPSSARSSSRSRPNPTIQPATSSSPATPTAPSRTVAEFVVDNLLPGTYTSTENDPAPPFVSARSSCDDREQLGQRREPDRHLQAGGRRDRQVHVHQREAWLDYDHQGRAAERRPGLRVHDQRYGPGRASASTTTLNGTLDRATTFLNIKTRQLFGHRGRRHELGAHRSDLQRQRRRHDGQHREPPGRHRPRSRSVDHVHLREHEGRQDHRRQADRP